VCSSKLWCPGESTSNHQTRTLSHTCTPSHAHPPTPAHPPHVHTYPPTCTYPPTHAHPPMHTLPRVPLFPSRGHAISLQLKRAIQVNTKWFHTHGTCSDLAWLMASIHCDFSSSVFAYAMYSPGNISNTVKYTGHHSSTEHLCTYTRAHAHTHTHTHTHSTLPLHHQSESKRELL